MYHISMYLRLKHDIRLNLIVLGNPCGYFLWKIACAALYGMHCLNSRLHSCLQCSIDQLYRFEVAWLLTCCVMQCLDVTAFIGEVFSITPCRQCKQCRKSETWYLCPWKTRGKTKIVLQPAMSKLLNLPRSPHRLSSRLPASPAIHHMRQQYKTGPSQMTRSHKLLQRHSTWKCWKCKYNQHQSTTSCGSACTVCALMAGLLSCLRTSFCWKWFLLHLFLQWYTRII